MKEYCKIENLFKFDEKYREIVGMTEQYKLLKDLVWQGTEKIDGTNIRIHWDGHNVEFGGRTDKAQIPNELLKYLQDTFGTTEMEYVFEQMFGEKDVILFGEGYGAKIQSGGDYSDTQKFILFDVCIEDYYLNRDSVDDIGKRLGIDTVPVVFTGNLNQAISYVAKHNMSTLGNQKHEMEGIVLQPLGITLYDNRKKPIKCKCKYRDFAKAKELFFESME